ncbi:MAG: hypothetical protein ACR2MA_00900 [Egibacteraceae bacterium]
MTEESARRHFRVLTRTRGGYNGATMYDVQLQKSSSSDLIWAQTFSDHEQARAYEQRVSDDLYELDDASFRSKYNVPSA